MHPRGELIDFVQRASSDQLRAMAVRVLLCRCMEPVTVTKGKRKVS